MNGADLLCDTLLMNGVNVCFANPGTSEMHFVAALDRKHDMRCVLGLSEAVVTGAADGYARMTDEAAATLLHCGPGLANGLSNIHNAKRARTPMVNIVGDHATYHLGLDAPLTSDIECLARPMSHWIGRVRHTRDIRKCTEAALMAAYGTRGPSTLILPSDAAWSEVPQDNISPMKRPVPPTIQPASLTASVRALRGGLNTAIFLSGQAMREKALIPAARISAATGARLFSTSAGRYERGAGRIAVTSVPYNVDVASNVLKEIQVAICVGSGPPVGFFAYPGKPGTLLPRGCQVIQLAGHEHDLPQVLSSLADALGLSDNAPYLANTLRQDEISDPATNALTADTISILVARRLPEQAIIVDESITSGGQYYALADMLPPHDLLPLTGGAIGIGIPLANGAALAAPARKVVALQADGSGMYTVQGLWTQAREKLNVLTIVFANSAYRILQDEMTNVGVNSYGVNARRMLELDEPRLDWCALARGMGVEAGRAQTALEFRRLLEAGLATSGPFLIEAVIE
ncbi:acetolactate synthase large subunit [Bradyrhizobium yuanmingense]|uniref:acetolactate synthase large subunit n=1 Tax=Bradyrhizobium yuanmingense TaxID=108015 RepID=UPI0023B909B6|nr:acetolactate synthase large subunit [Bradyrhizobium yuanmingense]MDF0581974.1 acetolactate synthase large subunit [Bradyrhizobium yuanmingense]